MQTRNRNKERSVRLSTIAHSPVPLAGMSYVLERSPRNPANARRNALDSPYAKAASLQAIYSDQTDTLYAHPTRFLPFPTAEVPAWYRPDPVLLSTLQPERVPTEQDRYRPPTTNTETLQAEADQPTARWIILPNRATTVYPLRQRFPEAEFALRRGKVYARVPTDDPADTPPLPERYYEEPPADLRRVQRDPLPNDATMFLYLYPHAPENGREIVNAEHLGLANTDFLAVLSLSENVGLVVFADQHRVHRDSAASGPCCGRGKADPVPVVGRATRHVVGVERADSFGGLAGERPLKAVS